MGPVCPVCEQSIDEMTVRRHLEEVLRSASADGRAANAAQRAVADAQAKFPDAQAVEARRALANGRLESATSAFADVASQGDAVFHVGYEWAHACQWESLLGVLNELRSELHQVDLALKQTGGDRLAEAEAAAESAASYLSQVTSEHEDLQDRAKRAASLDIAAHAASTNC